MRAWFSWLKHDVTIQAAQGGILLLTVRVFVKRHNELVNEIHRLRQIQDSFRDEVDNLKHAANATLTSNSMTSNERMPATTVSK